MTNRTGAGLRVGADHPALHIIVVAGVVVTALASFTISFTSLLAVAEWQQTPHEINFMTAIQIDVPVIVFTVATIMLKHREQFVAMWAARVLAVFMTLLSAGANFWHTVSVGGLDTVEAVIGASFNALAPILVLCCTELLGVLITRPKPKTTALAKSRAEVASLRLELRRARRTVRPAIVVPE